MRKYWPLPFIFVVWANCHGGVLLGFGVLIAGLGVQTILTPGKWPTMIAVVCGCGIAMLLTPMGTSFPIEMARSMSRIHLYPLDEWRRTPIADLRVLPFWIIVVSLCGLPLFIRNKLRRLTVGDATIYACALALLPMAIIAMRNMGPFVMVAVPALTSACQFLGGARDRERAERPMSTPRSWARRQSRSERRCCGPTSGRSRGSNGTRLRRPRCKPSRSVPAICTTAMTRGAR